MVWPVLLFAWCCVLCLLGRVLTPCCGAQWCAGSCCAVSVVLHCCVLLFSPLSSFRRCSLPFCGAPGCFCLCDALPWCVLLLGVALSRCVLVLVSAALCCLVLLFAVVCLLVLCCVVCFFAVLPSRLASSAAIAGCRAVSSSMVLCCPAVLPVVRVLSFLVPCFRAPVVSWRLLCGALLACPRCFFLCGALSPLLRWAVLCVVACCFWVFAVGPGCPLLSPSGFSWLLLRCFGAAVPVGPRGSPPCGLVWCVSVVCAPVLYPVVLCCRVVVCCCALLFVCVVACACCFFSASERTAKPVKKFSSPLFFENTN